MRMWRGVGDGSPDARAGRAPAALPFGTGYPQCGQFASVTQRCSGAGHLTTNQFDACSFMAVTKVGELVRWII